MLDVVADLPRVKRAAHAEQGGMAGGNGDTPRSRLLTEDALAKLE